MTQRNCIALRHCVVTSLSTTRVAALRAIVEEVEEDLEESGKEGMGGGAERGWDGPQHSVHNDCESLLWFSEFIAIAPYIYAP